MALVVGGGGGDVAFGPLGLQEEGDRISGSRACRRDQKWLHVWRLNLAVRGQCSRQWRGARTWGQGRDVP